MPKTFTDDPYNYIVWTNGYTEGWSPRELPDLGEVYAYITGDQVAGREFVITRQVFVQLAESGDRA